MANWKVVGPNSLPAVLLRADNALFMRYFRNVLSNGWRTGDAPQQWNNEAIKGRF